MITNIFSPLSYVALFGSGMGKNQDSGIRDKHPGSATLVQPEGPVYGTCSCNNI